MTARTRSATAWALQHRSGLLILGLMAVATALGLYRLGAKALWLDEGLSAAIAGFDPIRVLEAAWSTPTPGAIAFYYEVLHVWAIGGHSEFVLRSLSVACSVASVPIVYLLAVRLADSRAAMIAAALIAVSPFVVRYSQEARPYAMILLLSAAASLALLQAIERPSWQRWTAYALVAIAGLYTHNTMVFVFLVHGFWTIFKVPLKSRDFLGPIFAFAAISASCLPLVGLLFVPPFTWVPGMTLNWLHSVSTSIAGGTGELLAFSAATVALGTVAAAYRLARGRGSSSQMLAVALGLAPVALEVAISVRRPMLEERYLMVALPGLAVVAGMGIGAIRWTGVRWAALGAYVLLAAFALSTWYNGLPKEGWREAVHVIGNEYRNGDVIVVLPEYCRLPFDYYMVRDNQLADIATAGFPMRSWGDYFPALDTFPSLAQTSAQIRPGTRIWIVTRYTPLDPASAEGQLLWSNLPGYSMVENFHLPGVYLQLWTSDGAVSPDTP